ncbi:polyprenyl synthetase family protein [Steroidobacter cummioxidans]|uniref:polyprenyl synthetase family protein n=1 Tax=Steroidobacter cummioxidans TaxID=1803913 RepID=UPI000E31CBD3|nr:farnesyl diphosphate synthase [Steroidobacter cummioxidans]
MAVQFSAVQPSPAAGRHPDFAPQLKQWQVRVERELSARLPAVETQPSRLHEAIRYSVLSGGKRVRPALVYATGTAIGLPESMLDGAACAVELIHAYSLVHDDLPAMDDDDLRRGRPTCHKAYDEATAILVGDSLQCLAFELLAEGPGLPTDSSVRLELVRLLAIASGTSGMAGGQALDLAAIGRKLSLAEVEEMHVRKTGALIHVCVMMAAACAPHLPDHIARALDEYARATGLAFQIQDDLLDVEGDVAVIGKATGADRAHDKPTYPSVAGIEPAHERVQELHTRALSALAKLDAAGLQSAPLAAMSDWLVLRKY